MSLKKICKGRSGAFLALWTIATFIIYLFTKNHNSYTDNIVGAIIFGAISAFFLLKVTQEEKGEEFVINSIVYDTAKAKVLAVGRERSKFLGASLGTASWQKSQATFYQTPSGTLFSVDHSRNLEMALFIPVLTNLKTSCTPYLNMEECIAAMTSTEFGNLSAEEASRATGVKLAEA